jgi:hypothetical protein
MPSIVIMDWIVSVFRFIDIMVYPSLQRKYRYSYDVLLRLSTGKLAHAYSSLYGDYTE